MISINLSNTAILNINGVEYRCIIYKVSKCQAIKLLQNSYLNEKGGIL